MNRFITEIFQFAQTTMNYDVKWIQANETFEEKIQYSTGLITMHVTNNGGYLHCIGGLFPLPPLKKDCMFQILLEKGSRIQQLHPFVIYNNQFALRYNIRINEADLESNIDEYMKVRQRFRAFLENELAALLNEINETCK